MNRLQRLTRTLLAATLALAILGSGAARPAGATATDNFIISVYDDFLLDTPTDAELTWWTAVLGSNSRTSMVDSILDSRDFKVMWLLGVRHYYIGAASVSDSTFSSDLTALEANDDFVTSEVSVLAGTEFFSVSGGTNGGYIDALYQKVLLREPTATDRAYWVGQLDTAARTRSNVARYFIRTQESARRRVGGPSAATSCATTVLDDEASLASGSYCIVLDRMADSGGLSYWASHLTASSSQLPQLWASLAGSTEYFNNAQ